MVTAQGVPQRINLTNSCLNNPVANDPAVQAQALRMLERSVSGNPAGAAEWAFHVAVPYVGSGNWIGPLFTEGRRSEISGDLIAREAPWGVANLLTGYYPLTTLVHSHPSSDPPSRLSRADLNLGQPVIAVDRAGNMFCSVSQ